MIINIYALTPEKVMDIKKTVGWILATISKEVKEYQAIKQALNNIDCELSQAHRIKSVDPKNFV